MESSLPMKLCADSWHKAVEETRSRLYMMRAWQQLTLGREVELPVELKDLREKMPEYVASLMLSEIRTLPQRQLGKVMV